jgi:PAS domain S-box-containing protein
MQLSSEESALKILELQTRLDEYEQLIEAIKDGEVDAFALKTNNKSEIFTLHSVDYAYRLLIESFGEGAINISEDGLIVYTNNYFLELLDLPYEGVIGNSFVEFIHPDSKEKFKELLNIGLSSKIKGEINLLIGNKTIPVYISLTSLFPTVKTVGIIITDLTEKKKEEEILKGKNAELVKLNSELQAFAYIISHDLQGPLRKIQVFISRIIEKEVSSLSEKGRDYLNRVQNSASSMQKLIQELLNYSRTNAKDSIFEETELQEIIDSVQEDLKEELQEKHAILEVSELNRINIIPFQFHQLLYNLISNSLKFSKSTQSPHIRIKSEIAKGDAFSNVSLSSQKSYCHIAVSDNGIGFSPDYNEKIFVLFYRLHDQAEYIGTGIGLATVKKIVENHGGIITANSVLGQGTTFDIYIPVS